MGTARELHELISVCTEEDVVAVVESASHSGNSLRVSFALTTYSGEPAGRWQVDAVSPVAVLIPVGEDVGLFHTREHPLLAPFLDERAHLSFTGKPNAPVTQVVGALYGAHVSVVGDSFPLGQYMNTSYGREPQQARQTTWSGVEIEEGADGFGTLAGLLNGGYGTLADGPVTLMRAYADVLERFGVRVSIAEPRPAVRGEWGDEGFRWNPIGDVTLLLFGRGTDDHWGARQDPGYIIAREFTASRV